MRTWEKHGKTIGKRKELKSLFLPPAARLELSIFSPRHHSHVSHQNPCSSRSRIARGCHFSPEVLKRDLDANAGQQEDNMKSIQARHSQKRMQITTATNGNYYIITKASTAKKNTKAEEWASSLRLLDATCRERIDKIHDRSCN